MELKDILVQKDRKKDAEVIHLECGTMEEMLIIPRAEAPDLVQNNSVLLMEDGRLAARQERLLTDPTLLVDVAVQRVKPVYRQLQRAAKKLLQETIANATFDGRRRGARRTRIVNHRFELMDATHGASRATQWSSTSARRRHPWQDVVVVFYPLHRQTPLGEARRLRLVKKERPRLIHPMTSTTDCRTYPYGW